MDRIVSARVSSQRWYERFPRAVPLGAFALAMAITLLSVMGIERVEADRRQAQVRAVASIAASALARRATSHTAYLRAGAILMAAAKGVKQPEFLALTAELQADDEYRAAEGVTWAARVARADIPAFEAARRAEGIADFTVHPLPAPGQAYATVATYLGNQSSDYRAAYGANVYAEPNRREAMDLAARSHKPAASGPLRLMVGMANRDWSGFMIYMPVYAPLGVAERQQHLLGFLCVPFNVRKFLESAPELNQSHDFAIAVYDGTVANGHLLARSGPVGPVMRQIVSEVVVAQRHLTVEVGAPETDKLSNVSSLTLVFGTLASALVMVMARLVTRQAAEDRSSLVWLREQSTIRSVLTRELNHRVKNTLANVLSIIALTRRRSAGLDEFADALDGRIRALSATHDLLTESEWGPTPLRAVMVAELAPYREVADREIHIDGPDVDLAPNDALSMGLAIHELATNATKYGALSVASGRVEVDWEQMSPERVRVRWTEFGGPPVPQEKRKRGFGTELIERIVAAELGGGVSLEFRATGVYCELTLPVRVPTTFMIRSPRADQETLRR